MAQLTRYQSFIKWQTRTVKSQRY